MSPAPSLGPEKMAKLQVLQQSWRISCGIKPAIGITTKELSSAIPAIHEVIDRPRVLNPQLARHIGNLRVRGNKLKN